MDGINTAIDTEAHREYRPAGYLKQIDNIAKSKDDKSGNLFDLAYGMTGDAISGYKAGTTHLKQQQLIDDNKFLNK